MFAFEVFSSLHIARHLAQMAPIVLVESGKLAPLLMILPPPNRNWLATDLTLSFSKKEHN